MPTQLKSLYPFLFGDSGSDHSKMQGFVRKLQKVEIRSTENVKSVTSIPITHTHTHAQGEIRKDMMTIITISQYQSLLCNTCTLYT